MLTTKIIHSKELRCTAEVAECLARGGIVALPTETVYGLAANALLPDAVQKIFVAKNRPMSNPLIWHVHDSAAAQRLFDFESMSKQSFRRFALLAAKYWPGPLSIVGLKSPHLSASLDTIAVRVPRSDLTLAILKLLNAPVVMPSANISSRPSPTCAQHVLKTLDGRIDAVLDAGPCEVGIESTVIRIDQELVKILRPGLISAEELEQILDEPVMLAQQKAGQKPESPGLAFKHYAPLVDKILLMKAELVEPRWLSCDTILARAHDIALFAENLGTRPLKSITLSLPDEPEYFAQGLYNALYQAEEHPERALVLVAPSELEKAWVAIHDRLRRSSGQS